MANKWHILFCDDQMRSCPVTDFIEGCQPKHAVCEPFRACPGGIPELHQYRPDVLFLEARALALNERGGLGQVRLFTHSIDRTCRA